MLRREPTFRSELMAAANTLPWTLLDLLSIIPEGASHHAIPGEWDIRNQLAHLADADIRYNIPSLEAISAGVSLALPSGDHEPDTGEPLELIGRRLADLYNRRLELLLQMPPETWSRGTQVSGGGFVSLEQVISEYCLQHDAEHLAQLLETLEHWRAEAGEAPADDEARDARGVLAAAVSAIDESLLAILRTLPEGCAGHRVDAEWSLEEQLRHLLFTYRQYALPNLRAVEAGETPIAWSSLTASPGTHSPEPGPGASLPALTAGLRAAFEERDAIMMAMSSEAWVRRTVDGRGEGADARRYLARACVAHDARHLAQLLATVRDWRTTTGMVEE